MPGRHSLFWRLALLVLAFCLLIIWVSWSWGGRIEFRGYLLSEAAQQQLPGYAGEAEQAWRSGGAAGVERWQVQVQQRESVWLRVVGRDLRALGTQALSLEETERLTAMRRIDWPMSKRANGLPVLVLPFPQQPLDGQLVIELPERFLPEGFTWHAQLLVHGLLPCGLALLLCALLYRLLITPLQHLREQANALRGEQLSVRMASQISTRQDELGELGRAFDHMAERLQGMLSLQRQLLRDLSHELRTPLSRLRVACESGLDAEPLRQRLEREVSGMQCLVDDTLELIWLGTERPQPELEPISLPSLWALLVEDACFESGWPQAQLRCLLPEDCCVRGHLNGLAQALENGLRNAIRHSPSGAMISLDGCLEQGEWLFWLEDQGGGVAAAQLEQMFLPFIRLSAARPGGDGFGLGLAIARSAMQMQGGAMWAENTGEGLRLKFRLKSV